MAGELLSHLTPDMLDNMVQTVRLHAEMLPHSVSMSDMQESPKKFLGPALKIGSFVALGLGLVGGGIKSYDTVDQGHEGLRTVGGRLRAKTLEEGREPFTRKNPGELYGSVGPGPHLHRPWIGGIRQISTQTYNSTLKPFHVISADQRKREVQATVDWGVMARNSPNIPDGLDYEEILFRAMAAAKDREEMAQSVESMCRENVRHILRQKENPESVTGKEIKPELIVRCGEDLLNLFGVEIRGVGLGDVAFTEADTLVNGQVQPNAPHLERETVFATEEGATSLNLAAVQLVIPQLRTEDSA